MAYSRGVSRLINETENVYEITQNFKRKWKWCIKLLKRKHPWKSLQRNIEKCIYVFVLKSKCKEKWFEGLRNYWCLYCLVIIIIIAIIIITVISIIITNVISSNFFLSQLLCVYKYISLFNRWFLVNCEFFCNSK